MGVRGGGDRGGEGEERRGEKKKGRRKWGGKQRREGERGRVGLYACVHVEGAAVGVAVGVADGAYKNDTTAGEAVSVPQPAQDWARVWLKALLATAGNRM